MDPQLTRGNSISNIGVFGSDIVVIGSGGGIRERELNKSAEAREYYCNLFLRAAAAVLSLVAAMVLRNDNQTRTVALTLAPGLPAVNVPATAKWHYLSAFVYFVVANAIACTYATFSLLMILANGGGRKGTVTMIFAIIDLTMVALLFSSLGAALTVGLLGLKGNSHLRWDKVCNMLERYCEQAVAALGLSVVASLAFVLLVLIAILNLHRKI